MQKKSLMRLRIVLPFCVFTVEKGVSRIVAETVSGAVGILPNRMDFAAALCPGIFTYEVGDSGETYIAIAEGILIKTGYDVVISVRNAIAGTDLKDLTETVEREFLVLNEQEQKVRLVMAKMESSLVQSIASMHHE